MMLSSLIVRSICRITSRTSLSSKCISSSAKPVIRAWMSTKSSVDFDDSRRILPWLMLPGAIDTTGNGEKAYMFYSPAENKVITKSVHLNRIFYDEVEVGSVGCSSDGWLIVHNKHSHDLFFYDPVSNPLCVRRIELKLPSISSVPDKVIISSDMDMALICVKETLAFCVPGRTALWTDLNLNETTTGYKDFVYSSKHKLLFCETTSCGRKIESWDLTDPRSPRIVWQTSGPEEEGGYYDNEKSSSSSNTVDVITYLVFADKSDELFLVKRHLEEEGTTTVGFDVFVIDIASGKLTRYVDGSFNGLSFFVGAKNNSFAIPAAAAFPSLFSDSIYFTDKKHSDIGIYNYQRGTISYYPSDNAIKNSRSTWPLPAVWFTPTTTLSCTPNSSKKRIKTPWMFLPLRTKDEVYQFYSLLPDNNKVEMVKKSVESRKRGEEVIEEESLVPVECGASVILFPGSSHGWLALQHLRSKELYLSNPISRHHIKLPSIHRETNFTSGGVPKLVISSEPEDEEEQVRAMVTFFTDTNTELAFCVPGRSTEWTRLGGKKHEYMDLVYSSRHKLFFCMCFDGHIESWDLRDTASPRIEWSANLKDMGLTSYSCMIKSEKAGLCPCDDKNLIFDDHSNQLFLIIQHAWRMGPSSARKAAGFDVYKIDDWEGGGRGRLIYMDGSLNGLSLFVGDNNAFALSAADFPGLKPDSIYYSTGRDDFGIFNYQDATFSPSTDFQFGPSDPSPLWFTPRSLPY